MIDPNGKEKSGEKNFFGSNNMPKKIRHRKLSFCKGGLRGEGAVGKSKFHLETRSGSFKSNL